MFGWLRARHRRRILEHPFPESWNAILERNVAHWKLLDDAERAQLRSLVQVFVAEKQWEGCGGLELTDEIRITISGLACLLVLSLDHVLYSNVKTILVYPSTVMAPGRQSALSSGITIQGPVIPIYGQSIVRGPVVLVWDAVLRGAIHPERGHNVAYHEFAHKLDMRNGSADGMPPLHRGMVRKNWTQAFSEGFAHLQEQLQHHRRTDINPYGATAPAEFFAVVSEYFFSAPHRLHKHYPRVYEQLALFYLQDPGSRQPRPGKEATP